jgi:hypothetical protein
MSPIVRLVGGDSEDEPGGVFIRFPEGTYDLKTLEAALPELQKELAERWPIKEVQIRYRLPNPPPSMVDMAMLLTGAVEGLVVTFFGAAAISGGRQFGKDVGKQMARIVNAWLKRLEPKGKKARRPRKD